MIVKLKDPRMREQFERIPNLLKHMCFEFTDMSKQLGILAIITRISDPVEGESGVHLDHRAVDFRDEQPLGHFLYHPKARREMLKYFNTMYERNDNYRTLIWHSFKGGMLHFHLQLAPDLQAYKHILKLEKEMEYV